MYNKGQCVGVKVTIARLEVVMVMWILVFVFAVVMWWIPCYRGSCCLCIRDKRRWRQHIPM